MKNIFVIMEESKGKYLKKILFSFILIGSIQILLSYIDIKLGNDLDIVFTHANGKIIYALILMMVLLIKFDYERAKLVYQKESFTRIRLLPKGKNKSIFHTYLCSEILFIFIGVLWIVGVEVLVNFFIIYLTNHFGIYETHGYSMAIIESIQNMQIEKIQIDFNFISMIDMFNLGIIILDITMMTTLGVVTSIVELKKGSKGTLLLTVAMMGLYGLLSLSFNHGDMIDIMFMGEDLFSLVILYIFICKEYKKLF